MHRQVVLNPLLFRGQVCHSWFNPIVSILIGFIICCPAVRAQDKDFAPAPENAAVLGGLLNQYQQIYKDELSR